MVKRLWARNGFVQTDTVALYTFGTVEKNVYINYLIFLYMGLNITTLITLLHN